MQLLDLDGSNVRVTRDRTTTRLEGTVAKLSAAAAQALNQTFGGRCSSRAWGAPSRCRCSTWPCLDHSSVYLTRRGTAGRADMDAVLGMLSEGRDSY